MGDDIHNHVVAVGYRAGHAGTLLKSGSRRTIEGLMLATGLYSGKIEMVTASKPYDDVPCVAEFRERLRTTVARLN